MADSRSFQLLHWMDCHKTSTMLPEFEFKVIARYEDTLRRQLCEGLQILNSGMLNRKLEFNSNVISRLEVPDSDIYQESWLREKLEDNVSFKFKIKCFINVMSGIISDWPQTRGNMGGPLCIEKNEGINCCRSLKLKKIDTMATEGKRKRCEVESSTPLGDRREVILVPLDDSPIGGAPGEQEESESSNNGSTGSDCISTQRNRAGISNELDTTALTPVKELSSGTFEQNLYGGVEDLTRSGVGKVDELRNENLATIPSINKNWFAKTNAMEPVGVDDYSMEPVGVDDYSMEIVEEERKPPLILGRSATLSLLSEKGSASAQSPKRQHSGVPSTSTKRRKSINLVSGSASPDFKLPQMEPDKRIGGANAAANNEVKGKKGNAKHLRMARKNKARKEGKDIDDCQPRINNVFKRVDNVDVDGKSVDNVDVDGKSGMDGV